MQGNLPAREYSLHKTAGDPPFVRACSTGLPHDATSSCRDSSSLVPPSSGMVERGCSVAGTTSVRMVNKKRCSWTMPQIRFSPSFHPTKFTLLDRIHRIRIYGKYNTFL